MSQAREPVLFTIPKDTPVAICKSCRSGIYWIRTQKGKAMPVDAAVAGGIQPLTDRDGKGLSHFATCPFANLHRKPARTRQVAPAPPYRTPVVREQPHGDRKAVATSAASDRLVSSDRHMDRRRDP